MNFQSMELLKTMFVNVCNKGMIAEEPCDDVGSLRDLIGDFFLDGQVAQNDTETTVRNHSYGGFCMVCKLSERTINATQQPLRTI